MKRALKLFASVLVFGVGLLTAWPVFGFIAAGGPLYAVVFWVVVFVVVAWFFVVRRGSSGPVSESSMLGQKSKEGLL